MSLLNVYFSSLCHFGQVSRGNYKLILGHKNALKVAEVLSIWVLNSRRKGNERKKVYNWDSVRFLLNSL